MAKGISYREQQAELDEILAQLQAEDVDVDEALKLYEQATKLIDKLELRLKEAENQIRELKSRND